MANPLTLPLGLSACYRHSTVVFKNSPSGNKTLRYFLTILILFLSLSSCQNRSGKKQIWIYTSLYKEVIAKYQKPLEKNFPDLEIKWFQSGSENIAAKLLAQISAGSTQADIIMTSDLLFFQELAKLDKVAALQLPDELRLNPSWVDPHKKYALLRFPVMVLAYHSKKISPADVPKSFYSLGDPKYKNKITMPSPVESGTALITTIFLHKLYGKEFFHKLRNNEILAQGGNGASLSRIQSGERPIGLVLMENILLYRKKSPSPVEFVIPEEGVIPVPSPIAILKNTQYPHESQKVVAWFLSQEAQNLISEVGQHYPALLGSAGPEGAPAWADLKSVPWDLQKFDSFSAEKSSIKEDFFNIVLRR